MKDSPESGTGAPGLLSRIANSAEYSIAAALLAVCVVVGGALWWLKPADPETLPAATVAPTRSAAAVVDEREALDEWQRRLGEQFSEVEEQQRQRAEEEQARRARQAAEEAAAEAARRRAEAERQAQRQADARSGAEMPWLAERATPTPRTAARLESAPAPAPASSAAPAQPSPRPTPAAPARVAASIDWSSCSRPDYPALSVRRGEEGVVVIAVDLDAAARVQQVRVAQSSGHSKLDRATLEAVQECRFTPALVNGVAQAATAEVRFTWKLSD